MNQQRRIRRSNFTAAEELNRSWPPGAAPNLVWFCRRISPSWAMNSRRLEVWLPSLAERCSRFSGHDGPGALQVTLLGVDSLCRPANARHLPTVPELVGKDGQLLARYDKPPLRCWNLPAANTYRESETVHAPATALPPVCRCPRAHAGWTCQSDYDVRFPELYRQSWLEAWKQSW